jgi:nicotinamidase-related amidase
MARAEPVTTAAAPPEIARAALVIVDMQNDFVHAEGGFARRARDNPEARIDMHFLMATIAPLRRLVEAFRAAARPVVHVRTVLMPDYTDAQYPYWRASRGSLVANRAFLSEGSWGAEIIDELKPTENEHVVVKKGYNGFKNTPLDTILRHKNVATCVVAGVTTCVCVSSTIRGGVEHNYRMVIAADAAAEIHRDEHQAELKILGRAFADVRDSDQLAAMLAAR